MKLSLVVQQLMAVRASLDAASASITALVSAIEEEIRGAHPPPPRTPDGQCTHPQERLLRIPTMGSPHRVLCLVCHEEFDAGGE